MQQQSRAITYAALAVGAWSTVASAFKLSLRHLEPTQLLLYSVWISMLVLFVVLLSRGKLEELRRCSALDWLRSAGMGLLNPFLYYLCIFEAYDRLPGQEAQVLNYSWGIVLPLLSVPLLKQRIPLSAFGALFISFLGVCVVATRGNLLSFRLTDGLGVALAVGSSLIWALYWISGVRDRRHAVVKLFANFVWGSLFVLAWAALRRELAVPNLAGLLGATYVGAFEMGLTFVLWMGAMTLSRHTAQVANLIFLSPFVSLVLLHFVVGEEIYRSSVIGLMLIVLGILLQRRLGQGAKVAAALLLMGALGLLPASARAAEAPGPWRTLEPGLELGDFPAPDSSSVGDRRIQVLRLDPVHFELKLIMASADESKSRNARDWARAHDCVATVNASMYAEDHSHSVSLMRSAAHVNNGRLSKDNAVLAFEAKGDSLPPVRIIDRVCENYDSLAAGYGSLVQGIRMLSCEGTNTWAPQARQWSAVMLGMDASGRVLFIFSRSPYSMHDLIDVLLALPLDLIRLQYAEGGPEAQLFVESGDFEQLWTGSFETIFFESDTNRLAWPVPNVLGVKRR